MTQEPRRVRAVWSFFVAAAVACSGTSATKAPDACAPISASDYNGSCSTDSDCVAVVAGGDVCDVCDAPEFFTCTSAAIPGANEPAYYSALQAANAAPGIQFAVAVCGYAVSCPPDETEIPRCVNGKCAMPGVG